MSRNKIINYNPTIKKLARELRKNSTLSEVLLWKQIQKKALGVEFHRQVPLDDYIVDFFCHEFNLAIEIDGISHNDERVSENDKIRQKKLEELGVAFIRFDDNDVKKRIQYVIYSIENTINHLRNQNKQH